MKSLLLLLALTSCATVRAQLEYQLSETERFQSAAARRGLSVDKAHYIEALKRWPSLDSDQMHRRALILASKPSAEDLMALDKSRDPSRELDILLKLQQARH